MNIKEYLNDHTLLFDGAMGTYFAARNGRQTEACERANLTAPEEILAIHKEYIAAGAAAIKTNTFGVNRMAFPEEECRALLTSGWEIANQAGAQFVFGDIGPIKVTDNDDLFEEYRFVADTLMEAGAENFLFETHSEGGELPRVAEYIKSRLPDSFIAVSFGIMPDGFTRSGVHAGELLGEIAACEAVDAVGMNCVSSAKHMADVVRSLPPMEKPLSVMPNAGYPTVRGARTVYEGTPDYFARQVAALASHGAKLLGGCCGTTPAHIAAVSEALKSGCTKVITPGKKSPVKKKTAVSSPFFDALCDPEQRPFAVELDPPESAEVAKFMRGAWELRSHGADMITIADCPIARARMDSSLLACKLRRELNMEALPHMTCRDRNLNATKALLLGLCAEGVHNVLTITGDPIPSDDRDEVKSVYNFNSRMLARYIRSLGETTLPTPFHIFGALNVNAPNFKMQLKLAQEKEENGICGFLTQPVLTRQGLDNLILARETLKGKILGGIIPIVSHRNALFMNSEVAGITVDETIVKMYEGLDRAQGEALAVKISAAVAKEIAPYVDGYYLITPFGRTTLMGRIMDAIRENEA